MRFPSDLTNDELESLYKSLDSEEFNLPINHKVLRIGLLSRACQFFITVLKRNNRKKIKFYNFDLSKDGAIDGLLSSPQNLTSILMSDKVYEKDKDENGLKVESELKSRINLNLQKRLNEKIFRSGNTFQMFAVDHSIKRYAFPSCFYSPEESVSLRKSDYYSSLIRRIIAVTPSKRVFNAGQVDGLGQAIYELIENTEQHAKIELYTGKSKKSVRSLIVEYKLINKNIKSSDIGGDETPVTDYLEKIRERNDTLHLLEISIFDSGEGIFKTLSRKREADVDVIDEVNVIRRSFSKGETSKVNSQGVGRGLFNVRSLLSDRKGFISIRSGRVSLYRDFCSNPLVEDSNTSLFLYDEMSKKKDNFNKFMPVEGVAYSILVPVQ